MRTALAVVVIAAACGASKDPRPTDDARQATREGRGDARPATRAAVVDAAAAPIGDAVTGGAAAVATGATVATGAPVELAALPALGPAGPEGPLVVHAAGAHAGHLRNALARAARINLIEASTPAARITGRFGPSTGPHLVKVLTAGAIGVPARPVVPAGKAVNVDLDFVGARSDDLFRLLALILRTDLVLAAAGAPALDVRVRRMPADHVLEVVTARRSLLQTRHGNLRWLRAIDGPALDRALLTRKGPRKISIDANGAHAGEIYALLARLDALDGGAACDAGPPLTFRVRDLPLGTVLAVTAALSGQPPVAGVACAGGAPIVTFHDLVLRAIASTGTRRAAAFGISGGTIVATRGATLGGATITDVGAGYVTFAPITPGPDPAEMIFQLHPAQHQPADPALDDAGDPIATPSPLASPSTAQLERVLREGRLAATIVSDHGAEALFELPDDRWHLIDPRSLRHLHPDTIRIEPGKVVYRLDPDDGAAPAARTGEVVLRPSR